MKMNEKETKVLSWLTEKYDVGHSRISIREHDGYDVCRLIVAYLEDNNLPLSSELHDDGLPDIFSTLYQSELQAAVRLHGRIRYLHNKGVMCKSDYRCFVGQIQAYLGITVSSYAEHE